MPSFGPFRLTRRGNSALPPHGIQHLVTLREPTGPGAEAYRTLWTNVAFSTLARAPATILFTSPSADDGKSTGLANLGVVAAQAGRRILLVDCDLRRPTLQIIFDLANTEGLTTALLDPSSSDIPGQATPVSGLHVLTAGPLPSNPAEVLSSPRMDSVLSLCRQSADLVMLDAPPAGLVADALTLAPRVDGVIIVVNAAHTRREDARRIKSQLERVGARILGVVLNNATVARATYG
jgi:non-specific protein-tyrosine kinase